MEKNVGHEMEAKVDSACTPENIFKLLWFIMPTYYSHKANKQIQSS